MHSINKQHGELLVLNAAHHPSLPQVQHYLSFIDDMHYFFYTSTVNVCQFVAV